MGQTIVRDLFRGANPMGQAIRVDELFLAGRICFPPELVRIVQFRETEKTRFVRGADLMPFTRMRASLVRSIREEEKDNPLLTPLRLGEASLHPDFKPNLLEVVGGEPLEGSGFEEDLPEPESEWRDLR